MEQETAKITMLLVDDEEEFRQSTSRVLARRGFVVHEAASGEEAVEMLASLTPDIVLLDLRMDGMDGIATLREMRKVQPELPVIILTGHGSFHDALAGIKLEVVDFLQKPVDLEKLSVRVRNLLRKGKGRQAPMRERTIAELMVPVGSYHKVRADEPISAAVQALQESFFQQVSGKVAEHGHRSVLVYDAGDRFVGLIRISDVVALSMPQYLRDSPYASYFTGMFLAQCKTMRNYRVGDLVGDPVSVDIEAPVMEAVSLLVGRHQINLPVMKRGELVGILRDKDLLLEIASYVLLE